MKQILLSNGLAITLLEEASPGRSKSNSWPLCAASVFLCRKGPTLPQEFERLNLLLGPPPAHHQPQPATAAVRRSYLALA